MSTILKRLLKDSSSVSTGMMYGVINSVMLIPVTISFCSIIYRDKGFEEYLPQLVKLVLFSSLIHQWAFTYFSSLPFAIGQVQDAGLIFLSAMAADIVQGCQREEQIVPTTIVVLPLCTFLMGCMLVVVAKLKLATVIQYLPMPVIGGYLAFIGFFCGQAGLAMMAGVQVTNITEWGNFYSERAIILLAPGVVLGVTTYLLLCNVRSPYVLPSCMLGILTIFFGLLFLCGMSLEDAREYGWIAALSHPEPFYHSWALYDFSLVDWSMFPQQLLRLFSMFLVVAFSSSLDVAAIEMEMGLPLDYNRELNTVGIANMFSGLTGGYTGSYIFSQTIFTMRRGVYSRVNGYTVVLCEAVMIMLPISIISYLPKLFFGSLLVLISTDLMMEWLVAARSKMAPIEFGVCILTFFAIQATGIEIGMFIGILLAMASFVVSYSRLQTVSSASLQSSTVIRTFEERAALIAHRGKVVTISLKGYIFFGSAVKILEDVKSHVTIVVPELTPQQLMQKQEQLVAAAASASKDKVSAQDGLSEESSLLPKNGAAGPGYDATAAGPASRVLSKDSLRAEGPRMSFRIGPSTASKCKQPHDTAHRGSVGESAVKKLFPDISAPQAGSVGSNDAEHSALIGSPPNRSPAVPIRPGAASGASGITSGTQQAATLTVYDMSPETLQRMIEERSADATPAMYMGSFTVRELSTGAHSHALSTHAGVPPAAAAHGTAKGRQQPSPPVPSSAAGVSSHPQRIVGASAGSTVPVDIEMGAANAASPGNRSLLTERLVGTDGHQQQQQHQHNAEAQDKSLVPVGKKDVKDMRQFPFRRQQGQAKVPTSATATMAASIENTWMLDELSRGLHSSSGAGSFGSTGSLVQTAKARPAAGPRKVSFDADDLLASCGAGPSSGNSGGTASNASSVTKKEKPESLLSIVFEQQQQRQHRAHHPAAATGASTLAADRTDHPLGAVHASNGLAAGKYPGPVERLLRTSSHENPGESAACDGQEQRGMTRERSFQDSYSAQKRRPSNAEHLHLPSSPPPEVLIGTLVGPQENRTQPASDEAEAVDVMTEYLVLDFTAVVGVDATATRSCFLMLVQLMRSANVTVVFANMAANLEALFRAHKVIGAQDIVIPLLDDALEWCEENVLISAGCKHPTPDGSDASPRERAFSRETNGSSLLELQRNPSFYSRAAKKRQEVASTKGRMSPARASGGELSALAYSTREDWDNHRPGSSVSLLDGPAGSLGDALSSRAMDARAGAAEPLRRILEDYLEVDSATNPKLQALLRSEVMVRYFERITFPDLEILFDTDQRADKVYFIESGEVEIVTVAPTELGERASDGDGTGGAAAGGVAADVKVVRVNKVHAGGAFGEADFLLGKNHSVQAHTMAKTVLWTLDRRQFARMELEAPQLCLLIQHSLLKSLAIASTCSLYAQHPTTAYSGNN